MAFAVLVLLRNSATAKNAGR